MPVPYQQDLYVKAHLFTTGRHAAWIILFQSRLYFQCQLQVTKQAIKSAISERYVWITGYVTALYQLQRLCIVELCGREVTCSDLGSVARYINFHGFPQSYRTPGSYIILDPGSLSHITSNSLFTDYFVIRRYAV